MNIAHYLDTNLLEIKQNEQISRTKQGKGSVWHKFLALFA